MFIDNFGIVGDVEVLHGKGKPAVLPPVHAIVGKHKGGKPADDDQIVDAEVPEQECLEQLQIHHSILW